MEGSVERDIEQTQAVKFTVSVTRRVTGKAGSKIRTCSGDSRERPHHQVPPSPWGRAIPAPPSALDLSFSTELPGLTRAGRTRGDLTLSPDEDRRRPERCSVGVFVTSLCLQLRALLEAFGFVLAFLTLKAALSDHHPKYLYVLSTHRIPCQRGFWGTGILHQ